MGVCCRGLHDAYPIRTQGGLVESVRLFFKTRRGVGGSLEKVYDNYVRRLGHAV